MRLKSFQIVVDDLERSVWFYSELFGLSVLAHHGTYVVMSGGLVLQEKRSWMMLTDMEPVRPNGACELYFEDDNVSGFAKKVVSYGFELVSDVSVQADGRKALWLYDPDGHLIEVKET